MVVKQQITDKSFKISAGVRTLEIFITDKKVTAADSDSLVPKGYRKISVEEGTFAWKNSRDFRNTLMYDSAIWTNQKGLKSSGYQMIKTDNTFTPSNYSELSKLFAIERSYHYNGNGFVALGPWKFEGLCVYAVISSDIRLPVAYTKLSKVERQKSNGNVSAELHQKAQKELEFLSKLVRPESIEAISEIIRVA